MSNQTIREIDNQIEELRLLLAPSDDVNFKLKIIDILYEFSMIAEEINNE